MTGLHNTSPPATCWFESRFLLKPEVSEQESRAGRQAAGKMIGYIIFNARLIEAGLIAHHFRRVTRTLPYLPNPEFHLYRIVVEGHRLYLAATDVLKV
jgi:hypothetical protein